MSFLLELCGDWTTPLLLLGLVSTCRLLLSLTSSLLCGVRAYVLPTLLGPVDLVKSYGSWALVTGCTGGIGREYALALAARGMNLVLVSRSKSKLHLLEEEINKSYGVKTKIIQADFTNVEVVAEIVEQVEGMEIGVLVNNVGVNGGGLMPFLDMERNNVVDLITVNITSASLLCHALIPSMVKRGKGAVVNISSVAALIPGPYFAQYGASKHYIHALTEAITQEYKDTGVFIQEINPGAVETGMTEEFKEEMSGSQGLPSAAKFVSWALPTLGWTKQTCGYWNHSLQLSLLSSLPIQAVAKINKGLHDKFFKKKD